MYHSRCPKRRISAATQVLYTIPRRPRTMEELKTGWFYERMLKNKERYEKLSQWQKDMAEYVLNHGTDDEED